MAAETINAMAHAGELARALDLSLEVLQSGGCDDAVLRAASAAWVAAADEGGPLEAMGAQEAHQLQRLLILQQNCNASLPIFAHRIAAQHSAGVAGHLGRAARYLERTLSSILAEKQPPSNVVLVALLLRSGLPGVIQPRISALHKDRFSRFSEGQLRIPYSVVFDRGHFHRNVTDLDDFARTRGESLTDGSVPLIHLLLLLWLVPAAFNGLEAGWHQRAIDRRRRGGLTDDEERAARSLLIRFGGGTTAQVVAQADAFASAREESLKACGGGRLRALSRVEGRLWQTAGAVRNCLAAGAPLFSIRRRRPRIALCISGQLRGYRSTWPTWRPLLANAEVTTFVHTWKKIGRGTPEPFRYAQPFEGENFCRAYRSLGTELGLDELRRRYPSLFSELTISGEASEEELSAFYGTPYVRVEDEEDLQFAKFSNSDKMYWKVQSCFDLVEKSGQEFDVVVRIRPDKPIAAVGFSWSDMISSLNTRPILFCETMAGVHYGALLMGDQFAIGLPQISKLYAHTYTRMQVPMTMDLHKLEPYLSGHSTFAQVCWLSGIDVRKAPIKFGVFRETEPMRAEAIHEALARDATDRIDDIDRRFIRAITTDIESVGAKRTSWYRSALARYRGV